MNVLNKFCLPGGNAVLHNDPQVVTDLQTGHVRCISNNKRLRIFKYHIIVRKTENSQCFCCDLIVIAVL